MLAEHTSIARCPSAQTKAQAISKQKISVESEGETCLLLNGILVDSDRSLL